MCGQCCCCLVSAIRFSPSDALARCVYSGSYIIADSRVDNFCVCFDTLRPWSLRSNTFRKKETQLLHRPIQEAHHIFRVRIGYHQPNVAHKAIRTRKYFDHSPRLPKRRRRIFVTNKHEIANLQIRPFRRLLWSLLIFVEVVLRPRFPEELAHFLYSCGELESIVGNVLHIGAERLYYRFL